MNEINKQVILNLLDHLYWFYNADMSDKENQKDFLSTLNRLLVLIAEGKE